MTALHPGVVCAIVLCLALGMFAVLAHLAMRFIDHYERAARHADAREQKHVAGTPR